MKNIFIFHPKIKTKIGTVLSYDKYNFYFFVKYTQGAYKKCAHTYFCLKT